MKRFLLFTILVLSSFFSIKAQENINFDLCKKNFRPIYMHPETSGEVYSDTLVSAEERARDVIKRLSFEEKLELTGGWNHMYFPDIPKLGIPPVFFSDASQGINARKSCIEAEFSTAFPSSLALAATWNDSLAYKYAQSISEECRAWGINVLLGPGVNMYRNSEGGRNYEYYGEDPFLTSSIAVSYVKGMQSLGTLATVKHFIANEQELARHVANVKVGERALHEIYLPPFKATIEEAGALAIMDGNNMVNGFQGAANKELTQQVLRDQYDFQGIVMSDWANSMYWPEKQDEIIESGQSLLMSNNTLFADYIKKEIEAHPEKKAQIEKDLDKMVFYNLYTFFKAGIYDRPYRNPELVERIKDHKKIARQTAEEAITILKNEDHILPLKPNDSRKILVIGSQSAINAYAGRGSGRVKGYEHVNYLSGLKKVYGESLTYLEDPEDQDIESAEVVLYFVEKPAGEGMDIPFNNSEFNSKISHYAGLSENLVVLFSGGNGFSMPWLGKVKGLVFNYLLGQEAGTAMANVISGNVNASGKLPFSIEKEFEDSPAKAYNILPDGSIFRKGNRGGSKEIYNKYGNLPINYDEGIYIGYRWYDKNNIDVQFPFGFGLSYTSFKYDDIEISSKRLGKDDSVTLKLKIKNTGELDGAEIVQLYIFSPDDNFDRPKKELKGYKKIYIDTSESEMVEFNLDTTDFSFWNTDKKDWDIRPGEYVIGIGSSSKDIRQKVKIDLIK